jgi:hypothetical protein
MELIERSDVFLSHLFLSIGDKNKAVNSFQYKFSSGVIFDLPGHGIELNFQFISFDLSHVEGEEIKEESTVSMGFQADHLRLDLFGKFPVDIFKIGGFAATARTVIDNFHLHYFFSEIYKAQDTLLLPVKLIARGSEMLGVTCRCNDRNRLFAIPDFLDAINGFNNVKTQETQRYAFPKHGD